MTLDEERQNLHAFRDHVRNIVDSTYILSYVTPWFRDGEWFPAAAVRTQRKLRLTLLDLDLICTTK
uniref:Uncharacterized protein n=1 Tax=Phocoena sinus TaxID=42100 RepID=A0A8C9B9P4_PHOSS